MNDFITHINLDYNKELLLKEFDAAELIPYTPNKPTKGESWFSYQPDWLTLKIEDYTLFPETEKVKDYIKSIYNYEPVVKLFELTENVEIPPHKDMGHKACINIVLSEDPAPVYYRDYGEVVYETAMLNVAKRHGVHPGPKRKMIKFQLAPDMFYNEAMEIWNTTHSIT